MSSKPVMKFKAALVEVAIWEDKNGKHSASIRNQYRDKRTGDYKDTSSWYLPELRHLQQQIRAAIDYLHEKDGNRQVGGRPIKDDFESVPKREEPAPQDVSFGDDDIPF